MEKSTPPTSEYMAMHGDGYMPFANRAHPDEMLRYVLPSLKSGMRLLDAGCGSGALAVVLAEIISPGELHGVDIAEELVQMASQLALDIGCENASFRIGNVRELPFPDAFFDVVHCNDLLSYVPDTAAALEEIKRVLKPGGLLACREIVIDASFAYPDFGYGRRAWEVFVDVLEADDGHPQMGKELKGRLHEAGFASIKYSTSFDTYSEPDDIMNLTRIVTEWFLTPELTEPAEMYGAATPRIFKDVEDYMRQWMVDPGAVASIAFGQAVAVRP